MWKCNCGKNVKDKHTFCPYCGKYKPETTISNIAPGNAYIWCLALAPILAGLLLLAEKCGWFSLPSAVYAGLAIGSSFGFIMSDAKEVEKLGYNMKPWNYLGMFLLPDIYLFARAAKTDKNYSPAIIRIFLIITIIAAIICALWLPINTQSHAEQVEYITMNIFEDSNYCKNAVFMSDGDYEAKLLSYEKDNYGRHLAHISLKASNGYIYEQTNIHIYFRYNSNMQNYFWSQDLIFSNEYSVSWFKTAINWGKDTTVNADYNSFYEAKENIKNTSNEGNSAAEVVRFPEDMTGFCITDYCPLFIDYETTSNTNSYVMSFMEERKVEVNGHIENAQFVVYSSSCVITNNSTYSDMTFFFTDYSTDYNGSITIRYSPYSNDQYSFCINIPKIIICNNLFIPGSFSPNNQYAYHDISPTVSPTVPPTAPPTAPPTVPPTVPPTEPPTEPADMSTSTINALLNGSKTFIDFESYRTVTIYTLPEYNWQYAGSPYKYALVDLDGNGIQELLIEYDAAGDTAIISLQNNQHVAYYCSYRARQELKADGTMMGSYSADAGCIYRFMFTEIGLSEYNIATYDYGEISGNESYYIYGMYTDRETLDQIIAEYFEKADLSWTRIS